MRKIKWLFGLGAMSSLMALPLIAASCKKESLEQVTKAYKDAYLEFNNAIEKDAAKLKEFKNSINEQKQDDKKKEILKQKNDWVKKQIPILQGLRKKANDAFKKLRDVQKNQKIQIIKLVHTNDEHGRLVFDDGKFNNYSGMQGLAEVMSRDFDRDLLLSAGDLIQGLPLSDSDKGLTISKVAHQMGYDAVAIGNHEFDWGLPHMFDIEKATERMPFLSANTVWNEKALNGKVKIRKEDGSFTEIDVKTKDGKTPKVGEKVFTPYIIKTLKSGLKVGIMGITTPDTKFTSLPINSEHVDFLDPVQSANKAVEELKAQGVNFIVALTHLGVNRSDTAWDGREFAKKAKGVDIVLDGHSHTLVKIEAHQNNKTYLTQAECHTKYLSELDITINAETGDVLDVKQQLRTIEYTELLGGKENKLEKINKLIDDLRKEFDTLNKAIVFKSEIDFVHVENFEITHKDGKKSHHWKGRTQQTNLGTFGSDALAWEFIKANPQFEGRNNDEFNLDNVIGLMNGGGLRKDVPAGDVKREDILGISPFGNRAGAVRIKGSTLLEVMKHGALKTLSGGYGQYSHNVEAKIKVKSEDERNKRVYEIDENSIKINNKSIDKDKFYYVVTNDFILVGGDGYGMLNYTKQKDSVKQIFEGRDMVEVFIDYGKQITSNKNQDNDSNPFSKRKISDYDKSVQQKIIVDHKVE